MYREDPNFIKWFEDFHARKEKYPYTFEDYNESFLAFWHSDENRPFLTVAVDNLVINPDGSIDIFSRDYEDCIAKIWEWDYWKIEGEE